MGATRVTSESPDSYAYVVNGEFDSFVWGLQLKSSSEGAKIGHMDFGMTCRYVRDMSWLAGDNFNIKVLIRIWGKFRWNFF